MFQTLYWATKVWVISWDQTQLSSSSVVWSVDWLPTPVVHTESRRRWLTGLVLSVCNGPFWLLHSSSESQWSSVLEWCFWFLSYLRLPSKPVCHCFTWVSQWRLPCHQHKDSCLHSQLQRPWQCHWVLTLVWRWFLVWLCQLSRPLLRVLCSQSWLKSTPLTHSNLRRKSRLLVKLRNTSWTRRHHSSCQLSRQYSHWSSWSSQRFTRWSTRVVLRQRTHQTSTRLLSSWQRQLWLWRLLWSLPSSQWVYGKRSQPNQSVHHWTTVWAQLLVSCWLLVVEEHGVVSW